ncbi:MAG TPA: pyridoxal-dependent decarboxylase [Gemmataceae bacterium]|jgi:glutamate/tyrosine decarboxylase-like PLP-dependent enzyme|nr:pyridoxal-dependent decarboxylase [Gemmataceae bacterium]
MAAAAYEPFDLRREPLEEAARRTAELFVEIYRGLERRRVAPDVDRATLTARFAGTLGDDGIGLPAALDEFRDNVLPASMGTPHPLYLGLVNSSPLPAAALADLLVSALNNNGGAFHQSPAMTTCEAEVVRSFARLYDLPDDAEGMFLPGGTWATLQALVLARFRTIGTRPLGPGLRIYTSEAAHFSVARTAFVAGFGAEDVVSLPAIGRGELDLPLLREAIHRDRRNGKTPVAVVATAGTTGTGAVDPIAGAADLCAEENVWLHVDACYGGAIALLPELRDLLAGIGQAHSIAVDPHKWFFIPVTAALLLVREAGLAVRCFDTAQGSYIPGDGFIDAWRRGIPTTRRSSGLTVWMAIRAHGWRTIREAVRRNIALTRLLERLLAERGFTVLPHGKLSIACARWETSSGDVDRLQEELARRVVATGRAWFSTVRHAGRTWLRFNLVNLYTREEHIRDLVELLVETTQQDLA